MKAFLHKLKNDRRGVALEMAIILLVLTFALSTLVLTTSLLQHSKKVKAENEMPQTVALEQIGQSFCAGIAAGQVPDQWHGTYLGYSITVDGLTLTVSQKDSGTVLLTVVLQQEGTNFTVVRWSYN